MMMTIIDDDDVVVTAHAIARAVLLFFYTWRATWCLYVRKHGRERRQCRLESCCRLHVAHDHLLLLSFTRGTLPFECAAAAAGVVVMTVHVAR